MLTASALQKGLLMVVCMHLNVSFGPRLKAATKLCCAWHSFLLKTGNLPLRVVELWLSLCTPA